MKKTVVRRPDAVAVVAPSCLGSGPQQLGPRTVGTQSVVPPKTVCLLLTGESADDSASVHEQWR